MIGKAVGYTGESVSADPLLGPLQDNGGPTRTMLPQTGSPAIDAGDADLNPSSPRDQRGFVRGVGRKTDLGAVEAAAFMGGWVVQDRVTIPEEAFPVFDAAGGLTFESLKVNTNPFYVGGASVGAVTRVSRDAVINVSAGGGSVPTFVV